jgi:hypothetical protein
MVEKLVDRIIADQSTMAKIRSLATCAICKKEDTGCKVFDSPCHKGVYCMQCISLADCKCRDKEHQNEEIIKMLKAVQIKCVNFDKGCSEQLSYDKLAAHEAFCSKRKEGFFFSKKLETKKKLSSFYSPSETNDKGPVTLQLFKFHSAHKDYDGSHADYSNFPENSLYSSTWLYRDCRIGKKA